jgi:hypothetical protein
MEFNINASDNYMIANVTMSLELPNGSTVDVQLNGSGLFYYGNYSNTTQIGLYKAYAFVNDAEGNYDTYEVSSEVYKKSLFEGNVVDQQLKEVNMSFYLDSVYDNDFVSFMTNGSGYYKINISRRMYEMNFSFDIYNVSLKNQSFYNQPKDFIDIDRLSSTDIADELVGAVTGFAVLSNLTAPGSIKIDYSSYLGTILSEDNLRVYQCFDYNFVTKDCSGIWWSQIPTQTYKIDNYLISTFNNFSLEKAAIALTEVSSSNEAKLNVPDPNMTVYLNHSTKPIVPLRVENTGKLDLDDIFLTCVDNCDWYFQPLTVQ